jgi:hypothetical protein
MAPPAAATTPRCPAGARPTATTLASAVPRAKHSSDPPIPPQSPDSRVARLASRRAWSATYASEKSFDQKASARASTATVTSSAAATSAAIPRDRRRTPATASAAAITASRSAHAPTLTATIRRT